MKRSCSLLFLLGAALSQGASGPEEALELRVVEYVEPKGLTLDTADAVVVEIFSTFGERFGIPLYVIVVPVILALLAAVGIVLAVLRASRGRVSTGREGMIGEVGVVRRPVTGDSAGMVFVHGELWRALPEDPDAAPLDTGTEVEIVGFRRSAVIVRPVKRN